MNKEVKKVYSISPMGQAINEIMAGKYSSRDLLAVVKMIEEQRQKDNQKSGPKELSQILKDLKPRF